MTDFALPLRTWHADVITRARESAAGARDGDPLAPARDQLATEAEEAMDAGPFSVTHKDTLPPSGDVHDYLSQGPYWWPNPDTDDGLPYVRRDGEHNPEVDDLDKPELVQMMDAVRTLGLAGYVFDDSDYADRAGTLLRTWFLDEETRMNPHLAYGQRIPGRTEGRGIGIIDVDPLHAVCDAIVLVSEMNGISAAEHAALEAWFDDFLTWLFESANGRDEAAHPNNHGTWYDVQTIALALFVGREEEARHLVRTAHVGERRIGAQVDSDGRQPEEAERTRPYSYSLFNLRGLATLARLYEHLNADLWSFEKRYRGSIRAGLDWLASKLEARAWEEEGDDLVPFPVEEAFSLYWRAARVYDEPRYARLARELPLAGDRHRARLVYPDPGFDQ